MKSIEKLVLDLTKYNQEYRKGTPSISDKEYDALVEKLRENDPDNPFLHTVESEKFESKKEVKHPHPMLSIEKAYTKEQIERFIARVNKEAAEIGINNPEFTVMPKLDGLAGRDDGEVLATRGNGVSGYDITSLFAKGVIPIGGRGQGLGEIVIVNSYFQEHLADKFEHPRNMAVGIVAADNLNESARKALADKSVHFVPYVFLEKWNGSGEQLLTSIEEISAELAEKTDYPIDGMVAYVNNNALKKYMGATSHSYRWQIAIKTKGDTEITKVEDIIWQVGRSGNITPVLIVTPTSLSGATIRRVTAHNAGMVKKVSVGIGATIEIIRSGEVIPKLEKVIQPSLEYNIPDNCPSCGTLTVWNNDFLKCQNYNCKAQIEQRISHWFKTLGNADWFGIKTIQKLVESGYKDIKQIYSLKESDFIAAGFGPVQSKNLIEAITISKTKPVEDWRFLASFGIPNLGKGDSIKLLSYIKLQNLINLKPEEIKKIDGFGSISSDSIVEGIKRISGDLEHILSLGFNLIMTPTVFETKNQTSIFKGKRVVFTGKMELGTREDMEINARKLGAIVQSSISGNTDYLICGENAGASKLNKAKNIGIKVISEKEYKTFA